MLYFIVIAVTILLLLLFARSLKKEATEAALGVAYVCNAIAGVLMFVGTAMVLWIPFSHNSIMKDMAVHQEAQRILQEREMTSTEIYLYDVVNSNRRLAILQYEETQIWFDGPWVPKGVHNVTPL